MLYQVHLVWAVFELTTLVVIDTDCIGSYKSTYHTITTNDGPSHDEVYSIQHYVLKFVSNLRQVGGYPDFLHQ